MGLVIEDHRMAGEIASAFDTRIPSNSYEVQLSDSGHLFWTSANERYDLEPGATLRRRLTMAIASRLPIEWLL